MPYASPITLLLGSSAVMSLIVWPPELFSHGSCDDRNARRLGQGLIPASAETGIRKLSGYLATQPPSMTIEWPVTNDAESESSQTTPSPISEGWPKRPTGSPFTRSPSFIWPLSIIRATIGV